MKYILAVSGGVDSVVLLDILAKRGEGLIIAHFEHGIRGESSRADARFVQALAAKYGYKCEIETGNLGANASEEKARTARYDFLKRIATKYDGRVVTAHHQDDVVETIALNLSRGTGWRGLAVFGDGSIERPLLGMRKSEIYEYALKNGLEWVEDETNLTDKYLRNRLRRKLQLLDEGVRGKIIELFIQQVQLKAEISQELGQLPLTSRYVLTMVDEKVAMELLYILLEGKGLSLTRPQRKRLLLAIKTARPGDIFQAGSGISMQFTLREFIVNQPL